MTALVAASAKVIAWGSYIHEADPLDGIKIHTEKLKALTCDFYVQLEEGKVKPKVTPPPR